MANFCPVTLDLGALLLQATTSILLHLQRYRNWCLDLLHRNVGEIGLSNGAELFRGVTRVTPTVPEYWLEAIERIMSDIDCTPKQKLKGAVSLLRDKAYQWWLSVEEGDSSVAEYEVEFLRLSHYARGMVTSKNEKYVHFEDDLRDNMRVLIDPQREREFVVLVDKTKIIEEAKHVERQNKDRERDKNKSDLEPSSSVQRLKKRVRPDGPVRVGVLVVPTGIQPCGDCGRRHSGECWRRLDACLQCGYLEHRIRECP
ncbi:uncharacterized protein [Gossypium hirsutum]|uniref:ATP-dependent zinc metalloprotease FtsH n=1 Tax=Gossypium hirsutum TaxID=3635 RepID=A0A1U8J0X2_GOSHI|nr:uncharacterized protein LOC107902297 [Gossypium hirsutum]